MVSFSETQVNAEIVHSIVQRTYIKFVTMLRYSSSFSVCAALRNIAMSNKHFHQK
jgi:hypothetical protein